MPRNQSFERYLASRYLSGGEGRVSGSRFVRFVIIAATAGVAVGVGALLLALSITRGFSNEIERKIMDFGSHVQVESFLDAPLPESQSYIDKLRAIEGVEEVDASVVEGCEKDAGGVYRKPGTAAMWDGTPEGLQNIKLAPLGDQFILVILAAPLLCMAAAYLPAMIAATQDPADVLSKE